MKNIDKQLNIDSIQNLNNKTTQKNARQSPSRYIGLSKDTVSFKGTVAKGIPKITAEKAKTIVGVVASLVAFKTATTNFENKENLDDAEITINGKTYSVIEGLKPKYITDEEANSVALERGLTYQDIKECREKFSNFNMIMLSLKSLIKYSKPEDIADITREEILRILFDLDSDNGMLQAIPYLNDENIEIIKNKIGVDEINSVINTITNIVIQSNYRQKEPELISKLEKLSGINYDGEIVPLYRVQDYPDIVEAYQIDKELTERLINIKLKPSHSDTTKLISNGTEKVVTQFFNGNQIKEIVLMSKKHPKLTELVIDKATKDCEKGHYNRIKDIPLLIELYEKNPDFLLARLSEEYYISYHKEFVPRFELNEIKVILEEYYRNPEFVNKLLNEKDDINPGVFKNNGTTIVQKVKIRNKNPKAYDIVTQITTIGYNGKEELLYPYSIDSAIKLYEKEPKFFEFLVSFKDEKGKLRFTQYDIETLFASYEKEAELTKKLIMAEDDSGYRFNASQIFNIAEKYTKASDFINLIINMKKNDSENEYRFTGGGIQALIKSYEINQKLTKRLLAEQYKKAGMDVYQHCAYDIKSLVEIADKAPKLTEALLEMKLDTVDGQYRFSGAEIKSLVEMGESNPDFLLSLAEERADRGFIYMTKGEIEKIFNKFKNNEADYYQARNWIIKNIDNGISLENILILYATQQNFYREAGKKIEETEKSDNVKRNQTENTEVKSEEMTELENSLVEIGLHPRMAANYVKLCHTNGIVDNVKGKTLCKLIKAYTYTNEKGKLIVGISPKDVENIFELALASQLSTQNGIFRAKLIDDIVGLKSLGVDDVKLAINISSIINMDEIELKSRINTKVREDVLKRFLKLSPEILSTLDANGLSVDFIKSKASLTPKPGKINKENSSATATVRTLESIVGVEKVVLNKFKSEIPQEIWSNPESFKRWAEKRLAKILDFDANKDYIAVNEYAKYNEARIKGIESWYKFLKEESNYKDDVFVHLLVMDGITREMKPNNAYTPPTVSQEEFEATYNALLASNTKVSFSKLYAQQIRNKALQQFTTEYVSLNGIEGQWVTIPCSQRGDAKYEEHVAMVQALSEGSSWCLRFENAHTYLQQGNLHFFVDKNGQSQVAINETDGQITQIQKRYDQNSTVPIPYSEVISEWAKKNKYSGQEENIQQALKQKPEFDSLRNKVQKLMIEKNYEAVFELLDISYEKLPDGTYEVKNYKAKYNKYYTLNDLGINENELLANVSVLSSNTWDSSFEGSNVTSLPKLKKIVGYYDWGDCNIKDFSSLEKIGGKDIYWDR